MSLSLSRPYVCREGAPTIDRVDPRIFTLTYFSNCMSCNFCDDACCQYGSDVEINFVRKLEAIAPELEAAIGVDRSQWFLTDPEECGIHEDPEYPGGLYTRTRVVPLTPERSRHNTEACVFLDQATRGCMLHRFAIERKIDVHDVKPMICLIFPVCFEGGEIRPALELDEEELVCLGRGDSVYRSIRDELAYYFSNEMVEELDALEATVRASAGREESSLVSLPMRGA